MKNSLLLSLTLLAGATAFAQTPPDAAEPLVPTVTIEELLANLPLITTVDAQTCVSTRGVTLEIPALAPGNADGPVVLTHGSLLLLKVPAKRISKVKADSDKAFSFRAKDTAGNLILRAEGRKNSRGKYDVVLHRENLGIMGFSCSQSKVTLRSTLR